MIGVMAYGEGQLGVCAVNGTGGGEYEMADAVMSASFEYVYEAYEV